MTHHFIRFIEMNNRLLRNYSQNVDGLERKAEIQRLVQCHGSFRTIFSMEPTQTSFIVCD
jgi:NAD-dependent SIR2 family protein deacetylase